MKKHIAWLRQARKDTFWAEDTLAAGHFAACCFVSQQAAEKAMKAIAYYRNHDIIKSHSIVKILESLDLNSELKDFANVLDLYYITARYPDALPDNSVPADSFSKKQASEALSMAKAFVKRAEEEIRDDSNS